MACIAALIVGLASTIAGIVSIVYNPMRTQSYMVLVDGIATTFMGFQGARKINVPSNAAAVRNMCSVVVLVSFFCAAFVLINHDKTILETIVGSIDIIMALLCFTFAKRAMIIQDAK